MYFHIFHRFNCYTSTIDMRIPPSTQKSLPGSIVRCFLAPYNTAVLSSYINHAFCLFMKGWSACEVERTKYLEM